MAAALLMMNMHGAVMASDCDRTIFRYSEKIPFAIMVDPTSHLEWEDIILRYQSKQSINTTTPFRSWAEDFAEYLTEFFNSKDQGVRDSECSKKVICVGIDPTAMFPQAVILTMQPDGYGIKMKYDDIHEINLQNPVFHLHLGDCPNISILFGGMSDDIKGELVQLCANELVTVLGGREKAVNLISENYDVFLDSFDKILNDPQVTSAISDFTIKDMVAMAENLVDTESLQHLGSDGHQSSKTCEIGIVTLAERFKWIKHRLYGA